MQQAKKKIRCLLMISKKNEDKIFEQDDFGEFVIQSSNKHIDLLNIIKVILQFNKTIQSDLT